jgi:type I restriction enzyme S subunit
MNETLEDIARALFKSWFVDFEPVRAKAEGRDPGLPKPVADLFPACLVDSEQGEIPEGWEVGTVGQYMVNHDSKRVPVSGSERAKRRGPYPYHGAAGVMDYLDDYLFDGIYLLVGEDGSVVSDSGLGVVQYVWGKLWVNNHAHVLQGKGAVSTEQLYLYFQFEPVAPYVTGAVQPKLSQGRMNTMPFVFAGEKICHKFSALAAPWFAKLRICAEESRTLRALLDALLPELISGELPVKDASKFIGRTA